MLYGFVTYWSAPLLILKSSSSSLSLLVTIIIGTLETFRISLQIYSPSTYGKFISSNIKSDLTFIISSIVLSNFSSIST